MGKLKSRIENLEKLTDDLSVGTCPLPTDCICFPGGLVPVDSDEQAEAMTEAIAAVQCPIHGRRYREVRRTWLYRARWLRASAWTDGWPYSEPQFQKAMKATFPGWPNVGQEIYVG
jgi:hypothetical protein